MGRISREENEEVRRDGEKIYSFIKNEFHQDITEFGSWMDLDSIVLLVLVTFT